MHTYVYLWEDAKYNALNMEKYKKYPKYNSTRYSI